MRGPPIMIASLVLLGTLTLSHAQEAEPAAAPVNPNPLSSLSLESLSATRALPLFTPSRTAPSEEAPVEEITAPPPEPVVEPEQPPPSLQLVGIVLTDDEKVALLLDTGSNEVHRLASGEEYEGWAMTIVDARSVEFRSGERVEGLKMFETFPPPPMMGMSEDMLQGMPEGIGEPPPPGMDPGIEQPQPADGMAQPPPEEAPPLESFDGDGNPMPPPRRVDGDGNPIPPPEGPPPNFDPSVGEVPLPEEGPLPADGTDPG